MIYLNNFKKEYQLYKDEINDAVKRVLESGYYILGNECKAFEKEFADYIGSKYCVTVGNGTEAIHLSLRATGIKTGDEVITTCLTAFPTIAGIIEAGGIPVPVDINPHTCLMDEVLVEEKITKKTRFIVPVHLYGQCVNMEKINKISDKYNIKVIEDCAQSVGSEYNNIRAGNFGIVSAFSFYPTKNLGAYGDGGAVITNEKDIYEKIIALRNYGQTDRYRHDSFGINSRLDEIQAAVLRVKLKYINNSINKRRRIADLYNKNLNIKMVKEIQGNRHSYHLYVIFTKERDSLQDHLAKKGIQTLIHYPVPVYRQKAFTFNQNETYPITDNVTREILSIPINPTLDNNEVEFIINSINEYENEKN